MALNLDVLALRSLVAGSELGSFARAAAQVGRSTSAVSAQIHKLEEMVGTPLFRKEGRGLAMTEAGEVMLDYAKKLVTLNDEAVGAIQGASLAGAVRLGMQEDFGEATLPAVLGRFARAHPRVRVEARVSRNHELARGIASRTLDLALTWADTGIESAAVPADSVVTHVGDIPMCWVGPADTTWRLEAGEPVALAAFDRPCLFHSAATAALDRAGIPWRIAFTSPNLGGLMAAASAGLGLIVRTPHGLPASVRRLDATAGLPALGNISLLLLRGADSTSQLVQRLAAILLEALETGEPHQTASVMRG